MRSEVSLPENKQFCDSLVTETDNSNFRHPESILVAMLGDSDFDIRHKAVNMIKELGVRKFVLSSLNVKDVNILSSPRHGNRDYYCRQTRKK